jgi:hypothetical protein
MQHHSLCMREQKSVQSRCVGNALEDDFSIRRAKALVVGWVLPLFLSLRPRTGQKAFGMAFFSFLSITSLLNLHAKFDTISTMIDSRLFHTSGLSDENG